ncbi:MAG: hypothetical protein WAV25_03030 [Minisyncoccia bacterium]
MIAESGRLDIGPKAVNMAAGVKVNMDPIHLPVNDCHATSPTEPRRCNNNWNGPVTFTASTGESVVEYCQFESQRQGSIIISRDNNKKLQLRCYY